MTIDRNEILPRLWMGSAPEPRDSLRGIDVWIACTREHPPALPRFKGRRIRVKLVDDHLDPQEILAAQKGAVAAAKALKAGQCVLVTCAAGLNRSGLVTAFTLRLVTRMHPNEVLATIRTKRHPDALFNKHFVKLVQEWHLPRSFA